ncbi:hypothetical protein [Sphingorhabdus sp.]|uniref:hypothetical protein n=1 Tax=Sphingorhabdus sp. TaxID=1902408 RepID=UPI0035B38C2B
MKKSTLISLIGVSMIATPAFAADPSATYTVNGNVAAVCSITASSSPTDFGSLQNSQEKVINDTAATCNSAGATISVSRTNLVNSIPAADGFTNVVTVNTKVEAGTATVTNNGTDVATGAFKGLKITATTVAPSTTLMAGDYTGTITVTLNPGA